MALGPLGLGIAFDMVVVPDSDAGRTEDASRVVKAETERDKSHLSSAHHDASSRR